MLCCVPFDVAFIMDLMDLIPKDISLIVYRYVHRSHTNDMISQYTRMFVQSWDERELCFMEFGHGVSNVMWRDMHDDDDGYCHIYKNVYDIYSGKETAKIARNYQFCGAFARLTK